MARWQPDAQERLARAAFELFGERGFEETTVVEIAERAGLSKRTFFRYYADKREVLFSGQASMEQAYLEGISAAPAGATPMTAMAAGLDAAAALVERGGATTRARRAVVMANAELRERESHKREAMAVAITEGLRQRGVDELVAALTAEVGVIVFKLAYSRWVDDAPSLRQLVRAVLDQLGAATALPN